MVVGSPVRNEQVEKTGLIHFIVEGNPQLAWCGAALSGILVEDEVECVVCAELWENYLESYPY